MITLGVSDLKKSTTFYESVLNVPSNTSYGEVVFFELPGVWLALYPLERLAGDIDPGISPIRAPFSGITLAHNARSREDVVAAMERVRCAGGNVVKEPHDTFWGGFGGYFADPDGHYWELAWGPMFGFTENGDLKFTDA
jgi:catechol 2,3-dioxygenase-like lactoylglutathione lyase family enzyme